MKCCFFQFFNSPVALKNIKKFAPHPQQEKVEMTPLSWRFKARRETDLKCTEYVSIIY